MPPQEVGNELSKEDSADEDCTESDLNSLNSLCAEAEAYRLGATFR